MEFNWVNDISRATLSKGYLLEGVTAEKRVRQIADSFKQNLITMGMSEELATEIANKFYDNFAKGWYSMSSPCWANYGLDRGLPVSCFSGYIDDSRKSIFSTHSEMGELMANGGGTAGYFGALRPRGAPIKDKGYSSGPVHFMQMFDTLSKVVSQGSVRRGFFSPYLDAEHPDIDEFLNIGTEGNEIQNMTTGVVVGDEFMNRVKDGDEDARKIWAKVLKRRSELGFPYIMFRDNANNNKPEWYADMPVVASNMCKYSCTLSA